MHDDETLAFYDGNAADYAAAAEGPNPRLDGFLARLPRGGRVLELGSGAGVDAAHMLARGFDVDATDGSAGLAAIAGERIGRTVRVMRFDELDAKARYDGIYASASLLHLTRAELAPVIARIHTALRPGGIVWASFKTGTEEGADGLGRHYSYLPADALKTLWETNASWTSLACETWSGSGYDRLPTEWAAIAARR